MANELTLRSEPDEAFLVFTRRGPGGISHLTQGDKITITSTENPTLSIIAEVVTSSDFTLFARSNREDVTQFDSHYAADLFARGREIQNFLILDDNEEGSELELTRFSLLRTVLPIVMALASLQQILFGTEPKVRSITQNSPVNVSLEGAGGLYEKVATDIIPWRRERAKEIAALEAAKRRSELEQKRAEVLEAEAKTQKERAEAAAAFERARQARAEADLKEVELTKARFQLAVEMVEKMFPNSESAEKMQMISQMMPELVRLTGSVEIVAVGNGASFSPLYGGKR